MNKYRRSLIVVIVFLAIGISILWMNYTAAANEGQEMPGIAVHFVNSEGKETYINPTKSGLYWQELNHQTKKLEWSTAGPDNFFSQEFTLKRISVCNDTITLELSGQQVPDRTIMKRWPDSEWTPGDTETKHSDGSDVPVQWEYSQGKLKSTTIAVEQGSLYAIWLHYGDAWIEYSFLVNPLEVQIDPNTDGTPNPPELNSFYRVLVNETAEGVSETYLLSGSEFLEFNNIMQKENWKKIDDFPDRDLDSAFTISNIEGDYLFVDSNLYEGKTIILIKYKQDSLGVVYTAPSEVLQNLIDLKSELGN